MKWVSLGFLILAIILLPVWPYSGKWTFYPSAFCCFVAILLFLVSVVAKRGSALWKHRGQG
jgi:hypothetical protein